MARPFSLSVFVPSGEPEGLRVLEKSNWSGQGVYVPRALLGEAKKRPEIDGTGVYVLVGPGDEGDMPTIYVGIGDPVRDRLIQHESKKDFWTRAVFFVSTDQRLTRAHAKLIESRLIALAREAKRAKIKNIQDSREPGLSEAEVARAEGFLSDMLSILPLVELRVFEKPKAPTTTEAVLQLSGRDADARGYESADGFVVLKGSRARASEAPSIHAYLTTWRKNLFDQGVLVEEDGAFVVTQDYRFDSPSTAAGVLQGRAANGRVEWKDSEGKTLKELQEAREGA